MHVSAFQERTKPQNQHPLAHPTTTAGLLSLLGRQRQLLCFGDLSVNTMPVDYSRADTRVEFLDIGLYTDILVRICMMYAI